MVAIEGASFPDPWSAGDFEELLASPSVLIWVGSVGDNGVAGYLVVRWAAGVADILNLAVDPSARRRHLAHVLLARGLASLQERNVEEIFLEVRQSNGPAVELYLRQGFALVGVRRSYYRKPVEDALVLRHRLDSMEENEPRQ
jgi:ribosomal-protein-alanine N-acetyltransferase